MALFVFFFSNPLHAEPFEREAERYQRELDHLTENEAAAAVAEEIERARELLRLAREANREGDGPATRALLTLLPLQIRLVREILRALQAEREADELERRVRDGERERAEARERLERVIERLLVLTNERPE